MIAVKNLTEMKQDLLIALQNIFLDLEIIDGYGTQQLYNSVTKPFLSVIMKKVETQSAGCSDFFGCDMLSETGTQVYGKMADVTFGFLFGFPITKSKVEHSTFIMKLCSTLLTSPEFDFTQFTCGELTFDNKMQSFNISAQATTQIVITKEETYLSIKEIQVHPLAEERIIND